MTQNLNLGMKCVKYMLFVSNFMFVMVGVLLISFGSSIKSIYTDFEIFMEDHYFSPAILTVAIGIIILLIAAFGCAAALKESTCMVNMYALLLLLALVLEISAAIAAYSMRSNIEMYMEDKMEDAMKNYKNDTVTKQAVDDLQIRLNCCGIHNASEWKSSSFGSIPKSCCYNKYKESANTTCTMGCLNTLSFIVHQSALMLGTGALCVALVQVLGIVFASMLAKSIRRIKTERAARMWQNRQDLYLQLARANDKPANTPIVFKHEVSSSEA